MSVYVDEMQTVLMNKNWHWPKVCHMIADTENELHLMAIQIGLKKSWYQKKNGKLPHYDLTGTKRKQAIKHGAIEIGLQEFAKRIREYRDFIRGIPTEEICAECGEPYLYFVTHVCLC